MFTVSCYAFHPLILRFVKLWRYVQVVSEVLTCVLSMLCCQCVGLMPLSTGSSGDSIPSIQMFQNQIPNNVGGPEKSPKAERAQHLVIDFSPQREDTPEVQSKCRQYWHIVNKKQNCQDMIGYYPQKEDLQITELTAKSPRNTGDKTNIPAIHTTKISNKKGTQQAAMKMTP